MPSSDHPAKDRAAGTSLAILSVVIAMVSIQAGAALSKQIFPQVGPEGATALRLVCATALLAAFWRPWRRMPTRADWPTLAVYGGALGAMNLLFYMSLARIPLGIAVALEFTGPLAVAVANSRHARDWLFVALAAAGVLILLPLHEAAGPLDWTGAALALGAGACWAIYIVFGQKVGARMPGGIAASFGMLVAALVVVPVGAASAGTALLSPALLPVALAIGIFSSALPYSLEMVALKRLPPQTFSILMSGEPVCAAVFGLTILGEQLSLSQWIAIVFIITASAGSSLSAARARPRAPPPELLP